MLWLRANRRNARGPPCSGAGGGRSGGGGVGGACLRARLVRCGLTDATARSYGRRQWRGVRRRGRPTLPPSMAPSEQSLAERLLAGDKRALARAISLVEND